MATLKVQTGAIPLPNPRPVSQPYWDGCLAGELRFQRCEDCGYAQFNPGYLCGSCRSDHLGWETSSGRGTLYSWTVVWRPQTPAFEVPYAPAIVELDEGYWMLAAVVDCEVEDLREGLPLEVFFQPMSDRISLPYFRPATPG